METVCGALGYRFRDEELVLRALRHASVGGVDKTHNERLEFLGDALLGLSSASELYERHVSAQEGELTERRSRIVSRGHLARVGRRLGLEELIEVRPPLAPGKSLPDSVIAGTLEALLGAIYLDGGFEAAHDVARARVLDEMESEPRVNAKAVLQHLAQVRTGRVPRYRTLEERVHPFGRTFRVAAEIDERSFPSGWGRSKREAEANAAREALLELEQDESAPEPREAP